MRDAKIQPSDHVTVDGGTRIYTVQAVSRAGQDVYVTDSDNTSIGTWVDMRQVTRVLDSSTTRPDAADGEGR
jgi:hypothetical protein